MFFTKEEIEKLKAKHASWKRQMARELRARRRKDRDSMMYAVLVNGMNKVIRNIKKYSEGA